MFAVESKLQKIYNKIGFEHMRISSFFIPFLALLAGTIGIILRLTELSTVFDAITGLAQRDAIITLALIAFSALVIFLIIVYAIITAIRYVASSDFDNAFGTDSFVYPILYVAVGIVWLIATVVYYLIRNAWGDMETVDIVFTVFSAISAVSLMIFAIEVYKNPRRKLISALSLIPTLFMCFWLILVYRENASNPVLLSYAYACLAMVFAALGFYFTSGFAFGKTAVAKPIVCYFAAIYFCIVTLADDFPMSIKLIIGAVIFLNLFNLSMLLRNLQKKLKT